MTNAASSVEIHPYDPAWAERYRFLADRAAAALGDMVLRIEHVGSTSVPGLAAKPVIDLDVVVRPDDVPRAIDRLASLGYAHKGDQGMPGREAFARPPGEARHHLYVCVPDSAGFRDHILFRDCLRSNPAIAREYGDLKREMAERYAEDRDAYQQAKSAFIEAVTRRAEALALG